MEENIITIFISAGVSFLITIIYWLGKKILILIDDKKKFNEYKKYAVEFLENCIISYNKNEFGYHNRKYKLKELKIEIISAPNNINNPNLTEKEIPILVLGFLSQKYMLDANNLWLLRYILDSMYEESKWFIIGNFICNYGNKKEFINFIEFNIQNKENKILSFLRRDCYIILTKDTDKNKLETLLTKLKHNEFDGRIKKSIKQWISNHQQKIFK